MPLPPIAVIPKSSVRYRHWPAPQARGGVVLVHGLGAHSARWEFLAAYFQARGFSCWAIELQGFGDTPGPRGDIDSFQHYYADLLVLRDAIRQSAPQLKLFCLAESLGGLIAFRMAELHPDWVAGSVLLSPAFANGMKFSLWDYLRLPPALLFAPQTPLNVPFTAAMCTRDEAYQRVMEANPLELRTASVRLLVLSLLEQIRAPREMHRITQPMLFLLAGCDFLVKPQASAQVFAKLAVAEKKLIHYPEMRHALSIERGRETVFLDAVDWLKARLGA
jgi:lysophospholipase